MRRWLLVLLIALILLPLRSAHMQDADLSTEAATDSTCPGESVDWFISPLAIWNRSELRMGLLTALIDSGEMSARVYGARALIYLLRNEDDAAWADVQAALELAQELPDDLRFLSYMAFAAGREEEALDIITSVIERFPEDFSAFTLRSAMYAMLGRYLEAEADLDAAGALSMGDAAAVSLLISRTTVLDQLEDYPAALAAINDALSMIDNTSDGAIDLLVRRAGIYEALELHDEARRDYDRAIDLYEVELRQYDAQRDRLFLDQLPAPIRDWVGYLGGMPITRPFPMAYFHRSMLLINTLEDHDRGLADVIRAVEIVPTSCYARIARAAVYERFGAYALALTDLDYAINDLGSTDAHAYLQRGRVQLALHDLERARVDFLEALRLDPSLDEVYYRLGVVAYREGEFAIAADHMYEAVLLQPDNLNYLTFLAQIETDLEAYDSAAMTLADALEVAETGYDQAAVLLMRARVYLYEGRFDDAVRTYTDAIDVSDPEWAMLYAERGQLLYRLGEYDRARIDFAAYERLTGRLEDTMRDAIEQMDAERDGART